MAARSKAWVCGHSLAGMRVWIVPGTWIYIYCACRVVCQVEVSATGRSLAQRSPTDCVCVCEWVMCYWVISDATIPSTRRVSRQRTDYERKKERSVIQFLWKLRHKWEASRFVTAVLSQCSDDVLCSRTLKSARLFVTVCSDCYWPWAVHDLRLVV
jgi:hypothetical protein